MKDKTKKLLGNELLFVVIIYVLCVIIRFVCGVFQKKIWFIMDEVYYYQIAEGLADGRWMIVHNANMGDFRRFLYSLIISPAFLVHDRYWQSVIIQAINSMVISSAVFPYYLLTKKLVSDKRKRYFAYAFFLVLPELCYSMTVMTENLYLPMATWFLYFFIRFIKTEGSKKRLFCSAGLGLWIYLINIAKGNAPLFFIPAFFLFQGYECIKEGFNVKKLISRAAECAVLALVYFALRKADGMLWFKPVVTEAAKNAPKGASGSYDPRTVGGVVYGIVYQLIYIILGAGIVPAILPAMYGKRLRDDNRKLYVFLVLCALSASALISYAITTQEEGGIAIPAVHIRYVLYLWLPLLLIFLDMPAEALNKKIDIRKWIIFAAVLITITVMFKELNERSGMGQTMLYYIYHHFSFVMYQYRIILIAAAIFVIPLYEKCGKWFVRLFLAAFVVICLYNNILATKHFKALKEIKPEEYADFKNTEDFIESHNDENFIVLAEEGNAERLGDSYLNYRNVYPFYTYWDATFNDGLNAKSMDIVIKTMDVTYELDKVDYVVVSKALSACIDEEKVTRIDEAGCSQYNVYRLRGDDPSELMEIIRE